jgi:hypothetical protein
LFGNPAKTSGGKKDYSTGLMAIEEKLRPKDQVPNTERKAHRTLQNARHVKNKSMANSNLSDLKKAR